MDAAHPTSSSSTEQEVAAAPTIIPVSAVGVTEIETTVHPVSSVGCLYNGTSYELGEIFHIGCDERCECLKNGEVKCMVSQVNTYEEPNEWVQLLIYMYEIILNRNGAVSHFSKKELSLTVCDLSGLEIFKTEKLIYNSRVILRR